MDQKILDALNKMGKPVSVTDETKLVRMLLYGDPGIGKTETAAKIVEALGGRAIIITTDSNWVVITKYPELAAKIERYRFDGFSMIKYICEARAEGVEPFASFDTLIWDTVSKSTDMYIRSITKRKKFNDQRDPDVASWTHYGLAANEVKDAIDNLNKSGMHVIYTTHVRDATEDDKKKKRFAIRSNMPNECFQAVAQEVQAIGWLHREVKGGEVLVQFEPTNLETAKSQIPTIEQRTYNAKEIPSLIQKWIK